MTNKACQADYHVPVMSLWDFAQDKAPLTEDEVQHVAQCDECISMLGYCGMYPTLDDAQKKLRESM